MKKSSLPFPARLIENSDSIGELLRESLEEPLAGPSEIQSWHGLVQARERPARSLKVAISYCALAAGMCAGVLVCWAHWHQGSTRFSAAPEVIAPATQPSTLEPPKAAASVLPISDTASRTRRAAPTKLEDSVRSSAAAASNEQQRELSPAPAGETSPDRVDTTSGCAQRVRTGHLEDAVACYARIAQGNTMESELALYEKARLESRALGKGAAALATLDEHARRFPRGVLATEAGLTRIELLTRLGRTDEALRAIDTALAGPIGKERGGDLFALRGELLSNRGDCTAANAAFAAARAHGVPRSRPLSGEKRCAEHTDTVDSTPNSKPSSE